MKSNKNKASLLLVTAALALSTGAGAQNLRTGYFLEGYHYRHQMNPAFEGEQAYVGLPALGNLDVTARGNIGISNFLFKFDDPTGKSGLTSFMNSAVSRAEFLGGLNDRNRLSANLDASLLSCGFKKWGGFNTVSVGLHTRNNFNLPYDLFDFMKTGQPNGDHTRYHLTDLQMTSMNYADISFGHSRKIDDKLTVGATVKFLLGAGLVETKFDQMEIVMGETEWQIKADGYTNAGIRGASFKTKNGAEVDGIEVNAPGIGGFGLGLDLGASYKLTDDITLSAAMIDLGFIHWGHTLRGVTPATPYSFKGFDTIGVGSGSENPPIEDQFDDLMDDFEDWAKFNDGGVISKNSFLATTINIGGEYELPAYRKLSFGLLSSTHINRPYTWTEARASVNVNPIKWLEASVSGGYSTYGASFGFMVNFRPKVFNLFLGTDLMITEVTPQFVPVNNLNANVCMGINFTI